jgi:osmotically-inducible protein OsmY
MRTTLTLAALMSLAAVVGCDTPPPAKPVTNKPVTTPNTTAPAVTPSPGDSPDADNTGVNKRDRDLEAVKTPIDQDEDQGDVNITAEIRKRVLAEEDMSVNARNAKIITADGKVTLRGPVDSDAERDTIVRIAEEVAGGKDKVDNQLEVAEK